MTQPLQGEGLLYTDKILIFFLVGQGLLEKF